MTKLENIKYKLRDHDYYFLKSIQDYIDSELYFYGSVARFDYFPGKSDIDIVIITDNVESIVKKLQNYLKVEKYAIEKTVNYMHDDKKMSYAYKINYEDLENNLSLELFVYDEKYRAYILNDINKKNNIPFYIVLILYILKICFYYLKILPDELFKYLKDGVNNFYLKGSLSKNLITVKL